MSIISMLCDLFMHALFPILPGGEEMLSWSIGSAALILGVLVIRRLFRKKLSPRWGYALWLVVLLRLLLPAQLPIQFLPAPEDSWSEATVPMFPGLPRQADEYDSPYYQTLAPGELAPTAGSYGYVQRAETGDTYTIYANVYTPIQVVQTIWVAGMWVVLGAVVISDLRLTGKLKKSRTPIQAEGSPIPVYAVEGLPSPFLYGLFRPAVYLTPEAASDPVRLRHILAHELTHYAQKDHIWAPLRCLALALHWYDPLVWLAVKASKEDCELSCDAGAVLRLGEEERVPYGRTLVDMVAKNSREPLFSCSTAMTGAEKPIRRRVTGLVNSPETKKTALFLALSLAAILGVFSFVGTQQPKSDFDRFRESMDHVFYVQQINAAFSSQAGFRSIQADKTLVTAGMLLKGSAVPLTEGELASLFHYQSVPRLYPSLTIAADSGGLTQYSVVSEDGKTYYAFRRDGENMVPVASLPRSVVDQVAGMATREWEDSPIALLISFVGLEERYRFTQGEETISQLTQLFLSSPELLADNALPREGLLEKWLEEWTDGYTIAFGRPVPFLAPGDQDVWYARAMAQGSSYTLIIPDTLSEQLLTICGSQAGMDLRPPTEAPGPTE